MNIRMFLLGVVVDITDLKDRVKQQRVLDHVLRHNLRNTLNVIRGHAETIHEGASASLVSIADVIIETAGELVAAAEKEREIVKVLSNEDQEEPYRSSIFGRTNRRNDESPVSPIPALKSTG